MCVGSHLLLLHKLRRTQGAMVCVEYLRRHENMTHWNTNNTHNSSNSIDVDGDDGISDEQRDALLKKFIVMICDSADAGLKTMPEVMARQKTVYATICRSNPTS